MAQYSPLLLLYFNFAISTFYFLESMGRQCSLLSIVSQGGSELRERERCVLLREK
jgi:hypothetical protein